MPPRQQFHIYVDETSKDDTYFGVGAILCEDKAAAKSRAADEGLPRSSNFRNLCLSSMQRRTPNLDGSPSHT